MKRGKYTILVFAITISILVFLLLNLLLGSVAIPFRSVWNILTGGEGDPVAWQNIILKSRLPQALTALVAGAGLSISGLQMQTIFRNPLAGPSVLGISSDGPANGLRGRPCWVSARGQASAWHLWCYFPASWVGWH